MEVDAFDTIRASEQFPLCFCQNRTHNAVNTRTFTSNSILVDYVIVAMLEGDCSRRVSVSDAKYVEMREQTQTLKRAPFTMGKQAL